MCFTGCEAADVCSLIKFCKTAAGSSAKHLAELCGLTFFLPAPFSAMQSLTYPYLLCDGSPCLCPFLSPPSELCFGAAPLILRWWTEVPQAGSCERSPCLTSLFLWSQLLEKAEDNEVRSLND